ncbi:hypothetical protein BDAG_00015, partial [Burkholderia dolosa AU0158]
MRVDRRIAPPAPSGRPSPFVAAWFRAAALIALAAFAAPVTHAQGPFTVSSDDLAPGGRVGIANLFDRGDCKGENRSPQLTWRRSAARHARLRDHDLRSRRAGARLVALGGRRNPGDRHERAGRRERVGLPAAHRRERSAQRFRHRRLRRPVPAARQAASLRDHGLCVEEPRSACRAGSTGADVRARDRHGDDRHCTADRSLRAV